MREWEAKGTHPRREAVTWAIQKPTKTFSPEPRFDIYYCRGVEGDGCMVLASSTTGEGPQLGWFSGSIGKVDFGRRPRISLSSPLKPARLSPELIYVIVGGLKVMGVWF